jgi:putative transcriptional regulator
MNVKAERHKSPALLLGKVMDYSKLAASLEEVTNFSNGELKLKVTEVVHPEINVKAVRLQTGLSQQDFAESYGFSVGTVRNWEQGARAPEGPARVLLSLISRNPTLIHGEIKAMRSA